MQKGSNVSAWLSWRSYLSAAPPFLQLGDSITREMVCCHCAVTCHQHAERRTTVPGGGFFYFFLIRGARVMTLDCPYLNLGLISQCTDCSTFRACSKIHISWLGRDTAGLSQPSIPSTPPFLCSYRRWEVERRM